MARTLTAWILGVAALLGGCHTPDAAPRTRQVTDHRMRQSVAEQLLAYRVWHPGGPSPKDGWPLLLFLHGAGERGDDLDQVERHGPPRLVDSVPALGRCVLVAPQCPLGGWWQVEALSELLGEVCAQTNIDPSRLYVTGLSMGGYGTWHLLASYPQRFAAALPICGGGNPVRIWPDIDTGFEIEDLASAHSVPIRAYHGAEDSVVPAQESRRLVRALQGAGADATLTVYPGVGHDSWTRTYSDPSVYAWLFAQRRAAN